MFQVALVARRYLTRRRSIIRVAAIIAGVIFVGANLVGGSVAGQSQGPASPASDAEITAFVTEQLRDSGYPGGAFAIIREGRVTVAQGRAHGHSDARFKWTRRYAPPCRGCACW